MGQLKFILELSLLANFICISVILMSVVLLPVNVIAYSNTAVDCEFGTEVNKEKVPWVITAKEISEKTPPNEIIWNVTTNNIKSSVSNVHPHSKYLTGLRYTSRYVYRVSENFVNFVNTANAIAIGRSVTFTCNDGSIEVIFKFPLIDENDAPWFETKSIEELRVNLNETAQNSIINNKVPIVAVDKDFNPDFNKVTFTSDTRETLAIEATPADLPTGIGKKFDIKLKLLTTDIKPGRYIFNLFASDGQFTVEIPLQIVFYYTSNLVI